MALMSSLCIFVLVTHFATPIVCHERPHQAALFVFGDSIFDSGNNKYINTTADLRGSNYFPYGESFFKHPTGRASNGRLIPDFIAEYANLPFIPPYFEIGKKHLVHGVNFASGSSGILAETSRAIILKSQLKLFQNVGKLLQKKVGETESKQILSNAVYIFSTANNDFLFPLLANLTSPYSDTEYLHMVMGNLTSVLKGVYKQGGRKFVMFNLGPLGCLPSMRALNLQKGVKNGSCMEKATNKAKMFNSALPRMFKQLEKQLPGFKYTIFNFFKVFADSIHNPTKYGFKISETACCGTGPFRGILSCGGMRRVKEYKLCENVKDYLFFDSFHPTELAYQQYTKLLWNGTPDVVAPYNLESFFKLSTSSLSSSIIISGKLQSKKVELPFYLYAKSKCY
ncbi:GDSL esterase/lipase 1-like [Solanum verrucosum]|uniref:GDSL esterase/lipase 1-like n=1 Tax=Solanum verrucosum TaxID=315347 RepID=UPI0020D0FAD7|nr:GDSL esterase/lipase 1-like [Solanum verrucosum]